eukprot:gnl/TRDRNA2_/TRDRNA2_169322_c0_seq1.p1 gnl/TRDRNA2_/TRDRNA2_169322_c0~~gnl/TRDRNA2_/TRDRNA2_169322_c0_seq1.p1  ORF type:complete len:166 (-),score=28.17 gnl/TRDRNA2_/TRDRNA2_169322_c0_seq1:26-523(-)
MATFTAGQKVEVYSQSGGGWVSGEVTKVDHRGTVTVSYGQGGYPLMKDVAKELLSTTVRHIATDKPVSAGSSTKWAVNQLVSVWSQSQATWVSGRVESVDHRGTVKVTYRLSGKEVQKDIPREQVSSTIKDWLQGVSGYMSLDKDEEVMIWSQSQLRWVPGRVIS